jgi:DNA repair protein RadC
MAQSYSNAKSTRAKVQRPIPHFAVCEKTGKFIARRKLTGEQIIKAASLLLKARLIRQSDPMTSPELVGNFLAMHFAGYKHEVFGILLLDNQHCVIAFEELFQGTIDGASVYSREVVKAVLAHNAAAVVFAHNHPSGFAEPSPADRIITQKLRQALSLIDVRTLDHFIVGGHQYFSFASHGLMTDNEIPLKFTKKRRKKAQPSNESPLQ